MYYDQKARGNEIRGKWARSRFRAQDGYVQKVQSLWKAIMLLEIPDMGLCWRFTAPNQRVVGNHERAPSHSLHSGEFFFFGKMLRHSVMK